VGLYEWLRDKQTEVEQRQGKPLSMRRVLDSKVLVRQLESASKGRPGYSADLSMMHRLMKRRPGNAGAGMRLSSLKAKYRKEYGELRAERQGQQELL
jgi:hypothetical protein